MIRRQRRFVSLFIALVWLLSFVVFLHPQQAKAAGKTYYVDSINGSDSYSGQSMSSPWQTLDKVNHTNFQPGDTIAFKKGSIWSGEQLWPLGSGTSGSPISITSYGTGTSLPLIQGGGNVDVVLKLYNQQYWDISGLEITDDDNTSVDQETYARSAVLVTNHDSGVLHHIYLHNLVIDHVDGKFSSKDNGGILFVVSGTATPSYYDDIHIANNQISDIDRSGIRFGVSSWDDRSSGSTHPWTPSTNVDIHDNTLNRIKGDGIVVRVSTGPLVENNTVSYSNNHSSTDTTANVAIWPFNTDNAVIQNNEAYLTQNTHDGEGFDGDYDTHGTIIQYNYSHDNVGGFLLVCSSADPGTFNDGAIIRYNISQNDGTQSDSRVINLNGNITNTSIYNNTIYIPSDATGDIIHGGDGFSYHSLYHIYPDHVTFQNNIINNNYNDNGKDRYTNLSSLNHLTFDHNNFSGYHPPDEPSDAHKSTSNPQFINPGSGGTGRNTVDGYKLASTSPLLNAGVPIANNGGRDYWGNPVSDRAPDIGAFEYPVLSRNQPVTASSALTGNDAKYGNDGSLFTKWVASSTSYPQWWQVDLGTSHSLRDCFIDWYDKTRSYAYKIEVSNDNTTFSTVVDYSSNSAITDTTLDDLTGVSARYVRIVVTGGSTGSASFYEAEIR